jgi:Tol biopolymer transport system component
LYRVAAIALFTVLLMGCSPSANPRLAAKPSPAAGPPGVAKMPGVGLWNWTSASISSPDGSMSAWDTGESDGAHIYLRTTTGTRELYQAAEPLEVQSWWPDGQGLLVTHRWGYCNSCNADGFRLASLRVNGRFTDLGNFHPQAGTYAWSPHGDLLIGTGGDRFVVTGDPKVMVCNLGAASCADISRPVATLDLTPSWSPDGKFIVFARGMKPDGITEVATWQDSLDIWIARTDGSGQK